MNSSKVLMISANTSQLARIKQLFEPLTTAVEFSNLSGHPAVIFKERYKTSIMKIRDVKDESIFCFIGGKNRRETIDSVVKMQSAGLSIMKKLGIGKIYDADEIINALEKNKFSVRKLGIQSGVSNFFGALGRNWRKAVLKEAYSSGFARIKQKDIDEFKSL